MAERTVIHGGSSSFMKVVIPKRVWLSGAHDLWIPHLTNPDVAVSGRGRVIGLVLTKMEDKRHGDERATLVVTRYGMCRGRACVPGPQPVKDVVAYGENTQTADDLSRIDLPAGIYGLYLITDGAPVTVSLRLHGLSGTRDLAPTRPASVTQIEALPDATGRHFSGAGNFTFRGLGILLEAYITRSDIAEMPQGGTCFWDVNGPERVTHGEDSNAGCPTQFAQGYAALQTGQEVGAFHGHTSRSGMFTNAGGAGGSQRVYASFDPGTYRFTEDWVLNPTESAHALIGVSLGYESLS